EIHHGGALLVLRQADNEMKLLVDHEANGLLRCADLQVVKAVASLVLMCPSRSLVSGTGVDNIGELSILFEWLISR
ncbi:MAG: hypothetical protein ACRD4L_05995, partial [Pyrinomonadaceae bacterium]